MTMHKRISTGAGAVLVAGLLAAGCSEDDDSFFFLSGGDLAPQDFPAGSIADFNVAPDGAGLSNNSGDAQTDWKVTFACDCCDSDGEFVGDDSAIILFQVDVDGDNRFAVYACHYDGSTVTVPVELGDPDRDETRSVDLDAAICHFLGTQGYQGATQDVTQQAQAKQGNWVILYQALTEDDDPRTGDPEVTGIVGERWGLFARFFVRSLRGDGNEVVMADPASAWGNQSGRFRYGFQVGSAEVNAIRTAAGPGIPSSNVQSFGLVSDGLCGQSCWEGDGSPHDDDAVSGNANGEPVADAGDFAVADPGPSATATGNAYRTGEATTFVHLFFTQIANSRSTEGPQYSPDTGDANVAARFVMQEAALNLATLEFESPSPFEPTVDRNDNVGGATVGTGFYPTFYTYNDLCFYSYADGDLLDGAGVDEMRFEFPAEKILAKVRVAADPATGGSTLESNEDLAIRGGAAHDLTEQDTAGGNTERAFFPDDGTFIFGPDAGLGDTTLFFLATDGTAEGGQDDVGRDNVDAGIYAALIDGDGDLATNASDNPILVNDFADDDQDSPGSDDFADAIDGFEACVNRTGTYVALAYVQDHDDTPEGTTVGTQTDHFTALKTVIYAPFRPVASSTDPFQTTTPADLEDRFTAPEIVSDTSADVTRQANPGQSQLLPVNDFMWQDKLGYRCAFQSDVGVLWVLWEQSDTTEDRVFARPLRVDPSGATPTLTLEEIAEFETDPNDQVSSTRHDTTPSTLTGGEINQYNFLESSVDLRTAFRACDLGPTDAQSPDATDGGLFVVFWKVVDNTDGRLFNPNFAGGDDKADAEVFAAYLSVGDTEPNDRLPIGRRVHANVPIVDERDDPLVPGPTNFDAFTVGDILKLVCVSNDATLSGDGGHTASAIYVLFSDIAGNNVTSSRGLFAWGWNLSAFNTSTAPDRFRTAFSAAAFGEPARLDNEVGDDVETGIECCQSGTTVLVVFEQSEHVWGQVSSDGSTWITEGGRPDPQLADDDTAADVEDGAWSLDCCEDANGDARGGVLFFRKFDREGGGGVERLRGRGGVQPRR